MTAPWLDGAIGLASATTQSLDGDRAAMVLVADGRLGYATSTAFRPIAWGEDVDLVTVNTGDDRGTCVVSLLVGLGEVREIVPESAAVVTRRFREAGWQVSAQELGPPGDEPPAEPVEHPGGVWDPADEDPADEDRADEPDAESESATGDGAVAPGGSSVEQTTADTTEGDKPTRAERKATKAAEAARRAAEKVEEEKAQRAAKAAKAAEQAAAERAAAERAAAERAAAKAAAEEAAAADKAAAEKAAEPAAAERADADRTSGGAGTSRDDARPRSAEPARDDPEQPHAGGTGAAAVGRLSGRAAAFLGRGTLALLRTAVLTVGGVVVAILLIEVLLTLTGANPLNGLVRFFDRTSKPLAWQFKDLFTPRTFKANITENYGIAAVVYLLVTLALARVLGRLGSLSR